MFGVVLAVASRVVAGYKGWSAQHHMVRPGLNPRIA